MGLISRVSSRTYRMTDSNPSSDSEWEQYDEKLIGIQLDRCNYGNMDFERFSVPTESEREIKNAKKEGKTDNVNTKNKVKTEKISRPSEKKKSCNDTAQRGLLKMIGLESKTPILAIDDAYYLAERVDTDRDILIFTDPHRGEDENVKLGVRKVDAMFTASGVSANEYPESDVKKLAKKDERKSEI